MCMPIFYIELSEPLGCLIKKARMNIYTNSNISENQVRAYTSLAMKHKDSILYAYLPIFISSLG